MPGVNLNVTYHAGQQTSQTQSGGSTQALSFTHRLRQAVLPILHDEANRDGGVINIAIRRGR